MSVTINDAILLSDSAAGVTGSSQGTQYTVENGDLTAVLNGIVFEGDGVQEEFGLINLGSQTEIDGTLYTLTATYDFWGTGETINLDTGEVTAFAGQWVALTLTDDEGGELNFVVPGDTLTERDDWSGDPIDSVTVFNTPFEADGIRGFLQEDGTYANKLSGDDGVELTCFAAGTMIDTRDGPVPVESLRPGDLVLTRDNGYLPLAWVGSRLLSDADMKQRPDFAAVRIAAGALGAGLPERDTRVSPQHRMLLIGPHAELMFGEREVLVPAVHLVGLPGITRDSAALRYVHVMFDSHEIVRADGAWSESFQPADWSMDGLDEAQRQEILALFPELADAGGRKAYESARMTLKPHEARALLSVA